MSTLLNLSSKLYPRLLMVALMTFSGASYAFEIVIACDDIDDIDSCEQEVPTPTEEELSAYQNLLRLAANIESCRDTSNGLECTDLSGSTFTCTVEEGQANCALPGGARAVCNESGENGASCNFEFQDESTVQENINSIETDLQSSFTNTLSRVCTQRSVDGNLQRDCDALYDAIDNGDTETAQAILEQINPDTAAIAGNMGLFSQAAQTRNVQDRLKQRRKRSAENTSKQTRSSHHDSYAQSDPRSNPFESTGTENTANKGILLAFNLLAKSEPKEGETKADATSNLPKSLNEPNPASQNSDPGFEKTGTFVSGIFLNTEKDPTNLVIGADTDLTGFTAGIDHQFTQSFLMGVALGVSQADTSFSNNRGEIDATNFSVSYFGTYRFDNSIYLDATLSYGGSDFEQVRNIQYANVNQQASADFFGSQTQVSLTAGWDWSHQSITLNPYVQWQSVDVSVDDYVETMSDLNNLGSGWALVLDSQDLESNTIRIGTQASWAFSQSWGVLIPTARIEVVSELEDDPRLITGRFAGDRVDQNTFQMAADALDSSYWYYGLGVSAIHPQGLSSFIFFKSLEGFENLSQIETSLGVRWTY